MEDFKAAFSQRHKDIEALHEKQRYVACMHFGGVATECLLKSMLCATLPKNANGEQEWKTEANNPGHTIPNPGHDCFKALRCHHLLWDRVQRFPIVLKWLQDVENPVGNFIDMRYLGSEPAEQQYKTWYKSYCSLVGWLQKQNFQE